MLLAAVAMFLTPIPLYLDTIGCVPAAVLLGSRYGAFVAGMTALLLYRWRPALLPLAIVLSALFTGIVATIISTPIALYFAGNITSANEGVNYTVLENLLGSLFGPPVSDGTPSDLLNKLVVFWIVVGVIRLLQRTSVLKSLSSLSLDPMQH
ncbi:hypothetical protein CKALI_01500 [Corynebacterium kalinowskii]|uniref:Uncharacterized protein n=2 Tax=Corynebacterium kalinowskii TaxID=2675216 RepID=A0A6B8VDR3_9CORY|nr:hypothetical protein CKALI_01500 [Corynebacterium kalinowskii]